jgi:chromosome partitioning protein
LAEAPSFGRPIILYRPDSVGALAYQKLAEELLERERQQLNYLSNKDFGNFNIRF